MDLSFPLSERNKKKLTKKSKKRLRKKSLKCRDPKNLQRARERTCNLYCKWILVFHYQKEIKKN